MTDRNQITTIGYGEMKIAQKKYGFHQKTK